MAFANIDPAASIAETGEIVVGDDQLFQNMCSLTLTPTAVASLLGSNVTAAAFNVANADCGICTTADVAAATATIGQLSRTFGPGSGNWVAAHLARVHAWVEFDDAVTSFLSVRPVIAAGTADLEIQVRNQDAAAIVSNDATIIVKVRYELPGT